MPKNKNYPHVIILQKDLCTRALKDSYEKTDPNYPDKGRSKRILENIIIQYAKDAIKEGKPINALPCLHCRTPIKQGEKCVTKKRSAKTRRGYYHVDCAIQLNIL